MEFISGVRQNKYSTSPRSDSAALLGVLVAMLPGRDEARRMPIETH